MYREAMPYAYGNGTDIADMIALLAVFRNNLGCGDYEGARGNLSQLESDLGSIRADIGDAKYDNVAQIMNQTIGLMNQINSGNLSIITDILNQTNVLQREFCGLEKEIATSTLVTSNKISESQFETYKAISQSERFLDGRIDGLGREMHCEMDGIREGQHRAEIEALRCCCETQLRDQVNKADTDKQLCELRCGQEKILARIDESELKQENAMLKRDNAALARQNERAYAANLHAKTNYIVDSVGDSLKAFNGVNYPWDINNSALFGGLIG